MKRKMALTSQGHIVPSIVTGTMSGRGINLGQQKQYSDDRLFLKAVDMEWTLLERHFSVPRLSRYKAARKGNVQLAAFDYLQNILLAESLLPMLNTLEIALRNGVHAQLANSHGRADWWGHWADDGGYIWQLSEIRKARAKVIHRQETPTPDKILAELHLGFWCSLFNARHQHHLWKDLRLVFPHCPKPLRQRRTISNALGQVRLLRNRVFHHEPLLWMQPELIKQHAIGIKLIDWLDPALRSWLAGHDRLPSLWAARTAQELIQSSAPSRGCPAWTQASMPPDSGRTRV